MAAPAVPTFVENLKFIDFCESLEQVSLLSKSVDKLAQIFPDWLQEQIAKERCSMFPLVRLLIPDADRTRHKYNVGVKNLQVMIVEKIMQLRRDSTDGQRVFNFTNPNVAGSLAARQRSNRGGAGTNSSAGDFAQVIENVLETRRKGVGRTLTIGTVNAKLSELAIATTGDERLAVMKYFYNNFSAKEMKWTVRIILKNMMIGLKKAVVLKWYHPDAADYYDACNKLEQVLDELTDSKKRRVQEMKLFQIFTPMLAKKDKELKVQKIFPNKRERAAAGGGGRSKPLGNPFVVQPKYDGERIILHWDATACGGHGELALYTRNANIYTEKYGNALKPWLREHVKADKVILDGEMLSWDSTLHRFGQFGNNNGVMLEQQLWQAHARWSRAVASDGSVLYQRGHTGESIVVAQSVTGEADDPAALEAAIRSLRTGDSRNSLRAALKTYLNKEYDAPPSEELRNDHVAGGMVVDGTRWMCYMVFDIVFAGGLRVPAHARECEVGDGMLAGYPLKNRMALLERVLDDVPRRLERVRGPVLDPRSYVGSPPNAMHEEVMEIFDRYMLDRSEGAVLKDLKSPYLPGNAARKKGHWLKLKPDYIDGMGENLDLIILGCYYSEGCTYRSGGISHFVVGVAAGQVGEEGKPTRFHTLCKVGSGFSLLELTRIRKRFGGLKKDGRGGHLEEWRADNLPPHFARCADNPSGWVPAKNDDIPDVWIEPQFSITIEVRGANIVSSTSWSAKMVVRFPRLKRIRDDKEWYECMTMQELTAHVALGQGNGTARLHDGKGKRIDVATLAGKSGRSKRASNKRRGGRGRGRGSGGAGKKAKFGVDVSKLKQKDLKDSIFAGVSFCVMTAHATSSGIERQQKCAIERIVYENRGVYTALPCLAPVKTKYIVTTESRMEDHDIRVYAPGGQEDCNYDLVTPEWIDRCVAAGQQLEPEFGELLGMTSLTRRRIEVLADAFGDSYTIPLNRKKLGAILARMVREGKEAEAEEEKIVKKEQVKQMKEADADAMAVEEVGHEAVSLPMLSMTRNLNELEHTALLAVKQNVLRDFVIFIDGPFSSTSVDALNRNFLLACQLREMGAIVATKIEAHVTHIVIDPEDTSRVAEIAARLRVLRRNEQFLGGGVEKRCVVTQWAYDCVDHAQRIAIDDEYSTYIFDLGCALAKAKAKAKAEASTASHLEKILVSEQQRDKGLRAVTDDSIAAIYGGGGELGRSYGR